MSPCHHVATPLLQIQVLSHEVHIGDARIGIVDHMNCWSCLPWGRHNPEANHSYPLVMTNIAMDNQLF